MTQTVQARCPHCRNVLRIPAEWLDKAMRCKQCKKTFQAKAKASDNIPIAAPALKANAAVPIGQPAKPASPIAVGAALVTPSGSLFGFDEGGTPESADGSKPSRRGKGRGRPWAVKPEQLAATAAGRDEIHILTQQLRHCGRLPVAPEQRG